MAEERLKKIYRELITANHILHYNKVVDGYGHVSARHPDEPNVYIMSGHLAPAVVDSPEDLIHYRIADSSPVDPNNTRKGYSERFIHGEIFKRFPAVNAVVHSHSEDVLPYVIGDVPMRPVFHTAGFLGEHVPIYEIAEYYNEGHHQQDMLVSDGPLGAALASKFCARSRNGEQEASSSSTKRDGEMEAEANPDPRDPDYPVVLMRRHGFTTHGGSIPQAIFRAIYTCSNARALTTATLLNNGLVGAAAAAAKTGGATTTTTTMGSPRASELHQLTLAQCVACQTKHESTMEKPWKMWVREVESSPLYVNRA